MSEQDMLDRVALVDYTGLMHDLALRMAGKDGPAWEKAFKRFMRREDPWPMPWCELDDRLIRVDLSADPMSYIGGSTVAWNKPGYNGQVDVERREDDIWVGFPCSNRQKFRRVELRPLDPNLDRAHARHRMHPNILWALMAHRHMIPPSWRVDDAGRHRVIFCWGAGFNTPGGDFPALGVKMNSSVFVAGGYHSGTWKQGGMFFCDSSEQSDCYYSAVYV